MMGFSWKAAWNYKCPRCRQGDIFTKPLNLKDPLSMPERCRYCGQRTEPEIGFYYGAMMVSYGLSVWLFLGIVLTLVFYFKWEVESAMVVVIVFAIVTYLKLLRFSRSIWLHFNEKHKPDVEEKVKLELANNEVSAEQWKPNIPKKK